MYSLQRELCTAHVIESGGPLAVRFDGAPLCRGKMRCIPRYALGHIADNCEAFSACVDTEVSDAAFDEGLQRVKEHLLSGQRGAAVCLICLEAVRRTDAVWACQRSCSCTFHLLCIQVRMLKAPYI